MVKASDATEGAEFADAQRLLDSLPRILPEALLVESDYLRAKSLMRTRSGSDRRQAISILNAWSDYHAIEPELGIRLMLQQMYGLVMNTDKQPGRELEIRIREVLRERRGMDETTEDARSFLDRCASGLYEPDIAVLKIRDAARYHRPGPGQFVTRMPIERYKTLVNLAAEEVSNACYEDALTTNEELEELVNRFPAGTFPSHDYAESTALLAEYRLGRLSARQAAERQYAIILGSTHDGDPFYSTNNLAVYLALDEEYRSAIEYFDRLIGDLYARTEPEPSMVYLLRSNRCCISYVAGERSGLRDEWDSLRDIAVRIPYVTQRFTLMRHDKLAHIIADERSLTAVEFDIVLLDDDDVELGPMWDHLGRGFQLPSIVWWS